MVDGSRIVRRACLIVASVSFSLWVVVASVGHVHARCNAASSALQHGATGNGWSNGASLETLSEENIEPPKVLLQKCMASFGHQEFCQCLSQRLTPGVGFESYIRYVTRTKLSLAYKNASVKKRALIDSSLKSRDFCVARLAKK